MSKIFIGYNIDKIKEKQKNDIMHSLYDISFGEHFFKKIRYKHFGGIQIIYSDHFKKKSKTLIKDDVLVNICGLIENQEDICSNNKYDNIEDYIIDKYLESHDILEAIIPKLNGHFTIFLYNKKIDEILLINDKLGTYPTYTYRENSKFVYSTEVEALLCVAEVPKELNFDAIADFLSIGIVQNRKTFIRNVDNLEAATIMKRSDSGTFERTKYFNFSYNDADFSLDHYLELANEKLKCAVLRQFDMSKNENYVEMTGGFDTRLINSILVNNNRRYPMVFNMFPDGEKISDYNKFGIKNDLEISSEFAKKYGIDHVIVEGDSNRLKDRKFSFSGFMGGEILGGNLFYYLLTENTGSIFHKEFIGLLNELPIDRYNKNVDRVDCEERRKKVYIHKIELFLSTFFNYSDRMSKPWHRPRRFSKPRCQNFFPFLDFDFLEVVLKIPYEIIENHNFYILLLDKYYNKYCKIDFFSNLRTLYKYDSKRVPNIYKYGDINFESKTIDTGIKSNSETGNKGFDSLVSEFNKRIGRRVLAKGIKVDHFLSKRMKMVQDWLDDNRF